MTLNGQNQPPEADTVTRRQGAIKLITLGSGVGSRAVNELSRNITVKFGRLSAKIRTNVWFQIPNCENASWSLCNFAKVCQQLQWGRRQSATLVPAVSPSCKLLSLFRDITTANRHRHEHHCHRHYPDRETING